MLRAIEIEAMRMLLGKPSMESMTEDPKKVSGQANWNRRDDPEIIDKKLDGG